MFENCGTLSINRTMMHRRPSVKEEIRSVRVFDFFKSFTPRVRHKLLIQTWAADRFAWIINSITTSGKRGRADLRSGPTLREATPKEGEGGGGEGECRIIPCLVDLLFVLGVRF